MPFKECLRLDNDQGFTPIEESGEQDHESACSSVRTSRPQLAFLKQSELFPKEQVLGDEGGAGGKEQANEREQATFYKSLQVLLNVSESRIFFLRRTDLRDLADHRSDHSSWLLPERAGPPILAQETNQRDQAVVARGRGLVQQERYCVRTRSKPLW